MTPRQRVEYIRTFARELGKFEKQFPEFAKDIEYFFKNLPITNTVTPFHRRTEEDPCILELLNAHGKALLKRLYLADWTFVKVISYEHFFVEHLNQVDTKYETLYHIL